MMRFLFSTFLICLTFVGFTQEWKPLFNGKDLKNWQQYGGDAKYSIEGDAIVGVTKANTPNSFLATRELYSDFILEFEILADPTANTGVQFRSNSLPDYRNGVVHGYQCEIDPSARAFSGGIYDEQRRMWLYPMSLNEKGAKAFKNGMWNKVRIEAIGNELNTWINGVQCARLVDDMTAKGFIALQVHSVGSVAEAGKLTKWRSIRILTENFEGQTWSCDPEVREYSFLQNQLTDYEQRTGWRLLWDGKSSMGWRAAKSEAFPEQGWTIRDGVLTIEGTEGKESAGPGDIITVDKFSDFELELEFKITKGANSGIKYFVDSELNKGAGSAIGCEFQLLDDEVHPDAKMGIAGNRTIGSLYDLIAAENLSVPGRAKQFKGVDVWNKARIVSRDGKVEHWLNDEKVVAYDRTSQMFRSLVAGSKYKDWKEFGQWAEGHILLQDHGNTVSFRSIKIREF